MKIYIQNLRPDMSPYNGKGKFVQRLARELRTRKDIEIVDKPDNCDINFRMNTLPDTNYGKRVVRLDGFNFTLTSNDAIEQDRENFIDTLHGANGIIYQSAYAKELLTKYLGYDSDDSKNYKIIPNGVDPYDFKPSVDIDLDKKYYLFACQVLHPIRRLESLLNIWQQYDSKKWLYVVFDQNKNHTDIDFSKYKNVKVFDIMNQETLNHYMKNAIAVINLTYRDSCPNLLIEALACGTPVIADKESGIWEYIIGGTHGHEVDISLPERGGVYPIKNPQEVKRAMDYYKSSSYIRELPDCLKIKNVADKYIKYFEEILCQ